MKNKLITRLLILALALGMIFTLSACGKKKEEPSAPVDASEPDSSSEEPISSSEEPVIENALERISLKDKLDKGITRNKDTVGWLYLPNTTIDDAVLQAKDNDYYLRLTEDKVYNIYGCYFMDYESKQGTSAQLSKNNIIYGHSDLRDNKDGPKFSQLYKYTDAKFVSENPYIFYSTKGEEMVFQVFAVFYTNIDYKNPKSFYYLAADPSAKDFLAMVDEAKLRSEHIIDVPLTASDKILTLSTCSAKYNTADPDNYRLVVMAKLLPANKQLAPTMEVQKNPSPKKS